MAEKARTMSTQEAIDKQQQRIADLEKKLHLIKRHLIQTNEGVRLVNITPEGLLAIIEEKESA